MKDCTQIVPFKQQFPELAEKWDTERALVTTEYNALKKTIEKFARYVDPDNKASSGPKGLVLAINRRIVKEFGCGYDELSLKGLRLAVMALEDVREAIERTMTEMETRQKGKGRITPIIRKYAALMETDHE